MNSGSRCFYLQHGAVYAVPIIHYNMEMAAQVRLAFEEVQPDCVAVELAETMAEKLIHAASRLPDISLIASYDRNNKPLYYLCEPCEPTFEGVRCALEHHLPAYCIDLDVDSYPDIHEPFPDPYSLNRIGLDNYYDAYQKIVLSPPIIKTAIDRNRELYMAHRLKELSLSYDKILFVAGMYHVRDVLQLTEQGSFPSLEHAPRERIELCTLKEESCRDVLAECGWFSANYEEAREIFAADKATPAFPPDRQQLLLKLYKEAASRYEKETDQPFPSYHLRNIMKFSRNYALFTGRLLPNLYQLLSAAKGCVDHNYAYEAWLLATSYPYLKNTDSLPELDVGVEEVWGHSKVIRFHLREKGRKGLHFKQREKDRSKYRFQPPGPFSICSYPPEDVVVEKFGDFLKKKGTQLFREEGARTIPFSNSLEDGIDTRETLRHWVEKKLYVKTQGKPPGGVGSIVVIFDEDSPKEGIAYQEKYPWHTTWLGEHAQESDMALYSTAMGVNIIGPGISRCEYGGFMMSYPPRRMYDVWSDEDYAECRTKAEVLLMAAIDYAVKPLIVYVAASPPKRALKQFAKLFGKKIAYIPIGQLSAVTLRRIRTFHVLDSHGRRKDASEYIG